MSLVKKIVLFLVPLVSILSCTINEKITSYPVEMGTADLKQNNWTEVPIIHLYGTFKFQEGPLKQEYLEPDYDDSHWKFLDIPGSWDKIVSSKKGEGCYRLDIELTGREDLYLRLNSELSDCTFYMDGEKILENPSPDSSDKHAESSGEYIYIGGKEDISLLFHVKNDYYHTGGLFRALFIGKNRALQLHFQERKVFDLIFLGILLTTGIYHILLWLNRLRDKGALFFGIFCLLLFSRFFISYSQNAVAVISFLGNFSENPSFIQIFIMRFELVGMIMSVFSFLCYLRYLFPEELDTKVFSWLLKGIPASVVFCFFLPTLFFDILRLVYIIEIIGASVFALVMLGIVWKNKRDSIEVLFVGFLIFVLTIFIDFVVLKTNFQMMQVGISLFIFSQSFLIARRFSNTYSRLEYLTRNLQKEVEKKTESLRNQTKETKRANQAKSDFLSSMSHELRTPLNAILGYAQIIDARRDIDPPVRKGASIIKQSGDHLLTLINDILDLSKIEAGKLELVAEDFNFKEFILGVADIIRVRAEKKGIGFSITYNDNGFAHDKLVVSGDAKRLRQVLLNILNNGVKFTEQGTVELMIDFLSGNPYSISFQVRDTGVGMSSEQIKKIFLPFEQVGDEKKRAEGTGLGLPISKQLVEMMGGVLTADSEVGKGSIFSFELSFFKGENNSVRQEESPRDVTGYKGDRKSILIVDDKKYNREILKDFLVPLGFEVKSAVNGKEGIESVYSAIPDCVIMDMMMPVMNGFEAVRELRSKPEYRDLFILGVSASIFKKDILKIREAGCDDFLPKPITFDLLLKILGTKLGIEWVFEEQKMMMLKRGI